MSPTNISTHQFMYFLSLCRNNMPKDTSVAKIAAGFAIMNHSAGVPNHNNERRHHEINIVIGIAPRQTTLQATSCFAATVLSCGIFIGQAR